MVRTQHNGSVDRHTQSVASDKSMLLRLGESKINAFWNFPLHGRKIADLHSSQPSRPFSLPWGADPHIQHLIRASLHIYSEHGLCTSRRSYRDREPSAPEMLTFWGMGRCLGNQ